MLDRQRGSIPCYWESQPTGCLRPHCPFKHSKPRPHMPTVRERITQYKFDAIQVKSLSELRQPSKSTPPTNSIHTSQPKSKVQRSQLNNGAVSTNEIDGSSFKLENVLEEASQQARGFRKNSIGGANTLEEERVSQRPSVSKSISLKTSEEILGAHRVQRVFPVCKPKSQDNGLDPTSKLFTAEGVSSSESIFSPKFNPILSSLAAQKNAAENPFKLPFKEENAVSSAEKASSVVSPPRKRLRTVETYRPPARNPKSDKSRTQEQPLSSGANSKSQVQRPSAKGPDSRADHVTKKAEPQVSKRKPAKSRQPDMPSQKKANTAKTEQVTRPAALEFRVKSLDEIRREKRKNQTAPEPGVIQEKKQKLETAVQPTNSPDSVKAQPTLQRNESKPVATTKTKRLVIKRRPTISRTQEKQRTKTEAETKDLEVNLKEKEDSTILSNSHEKLQVENATTISGKDDKDVEISPVEPVITPKEGVEDSSRTSRALDDPVTQTPARSSIKALLEREDLSKHDESLLAEMAYLSQDLGEDTHQLDSLLDSKDDDDLMLEMEEFI